MVLIGLPCIMWLRSRYDRRHLDTVHGLLDQICEKTFDGVEYEHEQHRRVTLFKHTRFTFRRWPWWGGWLIPIERSGTFTRKTNAIFYAPDDGESCEGVGGRAWSKKRKVYVPGLPDLTSRTVTDAHFDDYAARSFCSAARLKKNPPKARSLLGLPVTVGQRQWGVIVIDSVNDGFREKIAVQCYDLLAPTLGSALKGV